MIQKSKRVLTFLLSAVMILVGMQIQIYAEKSPATSPFISPSISQSSNETVSQTQEIIHDDIIENVVEIESLREENVKHFRLSDGTYEVVIYGQPVHRKDQNGVWKDIDNNFKIQVIGANRQYITTDSRIQFAKEYTSCSPLFVLSENGYSISMTPINTGTSGNLQTNAIALSDQT